MQLKPLFMKFQNTNEVRGNARGNEVASNPTKYPRITGGVNGAEAAVHEVPEYTGAIGTAGDQAAPTVEKPTEGVRVLSDKTTGVVVAGLARDLATDLNLKSSKSNRPKSTRCEI